MTDRQNPPWSARSTLWLVLAFMLIGWAERGEPDVWLDVTLMFAMILSFMIAVAVPLLIARRFGYRLMWGRETFAGSPPSDLSAVCQGNPFHLESGETDAEQP